MAQFQAQIFSKNGSASRLGNRDGMTVKTNGWKSGVQIEAVHNAETGADIFHISATSGSNGGPKTYLGAVYSQAGQLIFDRRDG